MISARNQLAGKVVEVRKGQTTAHVRTDIGEGVVVTSSITNEAVDDLTLAVGDQVTAVVGFLGRTIRDILRDDLENPPTREE